MSQPKPASSEVMASMAKSKKRARDNDGDENARGKKKKKPRKTKPGYERDESLLDVELGLNKGIAFMDPQLLADHVAQKTTRFGAELSSIELADLHIPPKAIGNTTSWEEPRTLAALPSFLEKFAGDAESLGKAPKKKGAPHTIVVAGAGLRCADLVRSLRKYQNKHNVVAKLFAKHIKIEESIQLLQKQQTGLAVGTPKRLGDLIENGALSVSEIRRIVVDASHIDQKKWGILDMRETAIQLVQFLTRKEFKEAYIAEASPLQLLFY